MTKRFKIKISRILSFKSCRSKDPSDLPLSPLRRRPPPPPPATNNLSTVVTTVPKRRCSLKLHVLTAFGCGGSSRKHSSTPLDTSHRNSPLLSPTCQVNETPRRKIYDGGSERESLLPSSTNLSPEYSSPRVRTRRRQRKHTSESESSLSPARLSAFVQRLMPCTAVVVEGVAVVKRSEDPYEDFKGSMMEMIVEKKMFEVAELEQLLRCFLTLNAKRHHRAIVKAFSEVWVALFSSGGGNDSRRSSVRLSDYVDEC
ncbi:hypothetical protein AALP_AA3G347800 [Arabis alpina]|uniref:Transcription repressor n=1 Tax=Arabis alpina TaxID=50452 RepID=A0A087HDM9_ARAAL|nr:hypothetical protein AALP_AA3G347800 [Arabis alpina]